MRFTRHKPIIPKVEVKNMYYLAIDIGASSGRHILGYMKDGKIITEEIYRFKNGMIKKDNSLCWDIDSLFTEIIKGMKICKKQDKIPRYMGIDTWGVDFVLLDKYNGILDKPVAYRDSRNEGMDKLVNEIIHEKELYCRTGIQKLQFNTIYQLMALKNQGFDFNKVDSFLMISDYFHFLLTGIKKNEYTNATTTQLVNVDTFDWDKELIEKLGYNPMMFKEVIEPGTLLGSLKDDIANIVGFNCEIIVPASHDTASSVVATPIDNNAIYISSGTWSLIGIERNNAHTGIDSLLKNFTNEGGYNHRFRYLKNIMGLWMIQNVQKELENEVSFSQLCDMASLENIDSIIDCNNCMFLAPTSMIKAIQTYCEKSGQKVPITAGEISKVVYNSLASMYHSTIKDIENITGNIYSKICIIGGGSKADYLNQIIADKTKKIVFAGPAEATSIGNLAVQMIHSGDIKDIQVARQVIKKSYEIREFRPKEIKND